MTMTAWVLGWAGLVAALGRAEEGGIKGDLKKMEGAWTMTSREGGGRKATAEELKKINGKLVIKGHKYTFYFNGKAVTRGTIKLNSAKEPKAMDLVASDGPLKGQAIKAIYRLKGDRMEACFPLPDAKRPRNFRTDKGSSQILIRYQRIKP
jgi:uncharacterized protein (TIGR03067 family)